MRDESEYFYPPKPDSGPRKLSIEEIGEILKGMSVQSCKAYHDYVASMPDPRDPNIEIILN